MRLALADRREGDALAVGGPAGIDGGEVVAREDRRHAARGAAVEVGRPDRAQTVVAGAAVPRAAPCPRPSVQTALSPPSRRFMRWKTILLPDGDQSGSRPSASSNTCVLPVSRSFTLRTQSPPRPSCEEQYTIFLPSGDQLGCRLSVPRSLSTTTVVGASTRSAI